VRLRPPTLFAQYRVRLRRTEDQIPKEYKPGQSILVKLSGGRIVEAGVNHLIQDRDATKLQVDFGHDETALIELWQVLED
jgi:hypothetical protein